MGMKLVTPKDEHGLRMREHIVIRIFGYKREELTGSS
jgi:hypothetical protein